MYKKKILGNLGEDIACKFILNKGYEIVERNFFCRQGEIDIIALGPLTNLALAARIDEEVFINHEKNAIEK